MDSKLSELIQKKKKKKKERKAFEFQTWENLKS